MWKLKNYRLGFNWKALAIFACIMVPNLVWFFFPAPFDVLRAKENLPVLEGIVKVLQVLMVGSLLFLVNKEFQPPVDPKIYIGVCLSYFVYGACWGFYYLGFSGPLVILILCIAPSVCFLLEGWGRKNGPGYVLSLLFLFLHTLWGVLKFL